MPSANEPSRMPRKRPPSTRQSSSSDAGVDSNGSGAPRRMIRTDRIHYPGLEDRIGGDDAYAERRGSARQLRPVRDAGMFVERKNGRELRRSARIQRRRLLIGIIVLAFAATAAFAWQATSDRRAASANDRAATLARTGAKAPGVPVAEAAEAQPTPVFATYKGFKLHLPMSLGDLTELAFHQASYSYALPMKTHLPPADIGDAKADRGTGRDINTQEAGDAVPLVGSALVLWRDRPGKPDTAVDVGAVPGTVVLAPVTGTVVLVKKYSLYNKYEDYQLHIQPDGYPNADVVVIHFSDPSVKAGDRVVGGVTPFGKVRNLSSKMNLQLRTYTKGGGDHVHIQVNDARDPSYEGLDGALKVIEGATE